MATQLSILCLGSGLNAVQYSKRIITRILFFAGGGSRLHWSALCTSACDIFIVCNLMGGGLLFFVKGGPLLASILDWGKGLVDECAF